MTYLISEVNRERQKLLAKVLAPVMDRLLDVLQLPQDLRCLDLGCGIGETTRQLARKLDSPEEVIGVELDTDLVEAARGFAWQACSKRPWALPNSPFASSTSPSSRSVPVSSGLIRRALSSAPCAAVSCSDAASNSPLRWNAR